MSFRQRTGLALAASLAWVSAPAAAQDEAALVKEANALSEQGLDLVLKGRRAEGAEAYRKAAKAMEQIAWRCGRIEGGAVLGCRYDEDTLGSYLFDYARTAHDLGKTAQGDKAFEAAMARFEPRWKGCDGPEWGTACDRAANKRRQFLGWYARYLDLSEQKEKGAAVHAGIVDGLRQDLVACTNEDKCGEILGDLTFAVPHYRDALTAAGKGDAAFALVEEFIPRFVASPAFARGAKDGADWSDERFHGGAMEIVEAYASAARGTAREDKSRAVLAQIGQGTLASSADSAQDFAARRAALDAEYSKASGSYARQAEVLERKAALDKEQFGAESVEYAEALRERASALSLADHKAGAEALFRQSLAITRKAAGDGNFRTLYATAYLSGFLARNGRERDAASVLTDVLAAPANDLSALYADPQRARGLAGRIVGRVEIIDRLKADQAIHLLATGGTPATALGAARHAVAGIRAFRDALGYDRFDEARLDTLEGDPFAFLGERRLDEYFVLAADALWAAGRRDSAAAAEALSALQDATNGVTGRAVAQAAAERVAQRAGVAPLLAERAALNAANVKLEQEQLALAATQGSDQRRLTALFDEAARNEERRKTLDAQIAALAPDYFALTRPRPLDQSAARALFGADDAALILVPSRFGTHVVLVDRDGVAWNRADLTDAAIGQKVRRLLWDVGANVAVSDAENAAWTAEGSGPSPFARGVAHELYRELIAPFADRLAPRKQLAIVAAGSLSSLPFSLLVAEPPQGRDGDPEALRSTAWLGDRFALVQLPSLQSLQLLRAAPQAAAAARPRFLGYGDPVLEGSAETRGLPGRKQRRDGAVFAGTDAADVRETALADVAALRTMARLPGTARELIAMREEFPAASATIHLAEDATEARLKRDDLTGLSVLALSTHGLLAGEAEQLGVAQPGLVLTPPARATMLDDGLLTASEVVGLKTDAEWVILSACNTAAGDGSGGAEGLSGLARAFFFAGARSLLASHWPVRDAVAAVITVKVLELEKAHPEWSRAQALQAAEREIRNDTSADADLATWAHPSAWAPFSFIGDWRR